MSNLPWSLIQRLNHVSVIALLQSRGAQPVEFTGKPDGLVRLNLNGVIAFIPTDASQSGYHDSLAAVVEWANQIGPTHPEGVAGQLRDLVMGKGDVFRFRLEEESVISGTIPFGRADILVSFTRSAIEEAERSYLVKKRYEVPRGTKLPSQGDWSQECRLGQTEEGSYVVKVHCPLGQRFTEEDIEETFLPRLVEEMDGNGNGRFISIHLLKSLELIQGMAEARDPNWVRSEECKRHFVPLRLVKALSVAAPMRDGELSISCSWSKTAKIPDKIQNKIMFSRRHQPVLEQAANIIKPTADELGRMECQAMVTAVKADPNPDTRTEGQVTFLVVVGSNSFKVRATLDRLRYDRAVEAHRSGRTLTVIGKIKKKSRGLAQFDGDWDLIL